MEQKNSREINESLLEEEFIDEDDLSQRMSPRPKGGKPEMNKTKFQKNHKKSKIITKKATKQATKRVEVASVFNGGKNMLQDTDKSTDKITVSDLNRSSPEIKIEPATVDPWANQTESTFFKESSTWKVITGVMLVLLLFSVLTQGFNFETTSGVQLSLGEAQAKAVEFVNDNLLRPPFVATVVSSEETNNLYKITLSVADEEVDSYLTKDGSLFFPQGFVIAEVADLIAQQEEIIDENNADVALEEAPAEIVDTEETSPGAEEASPQVSEEETPENVPVVSVNGAAVNDELIEGSVAEERQADVVVENVDSTVQENKEEATSSEVPTVETTKTSPDVTLHLSYKKWFFSPQKLTVKKGQIVKLVLQSDASSPSSVLPIFTFAIPQLSVEQLVEGKAEVIFTADQVGTFSFGCSSCESWRGMSGSLVVG